MKKFKFFVFVAALMMSAACSKDIGDVGEAISPTEPTIEQKPEISFSPEEMGYLTELANGTPKISVDSAAKVALQVMGNSLSKRSLSVTAFGTPKAGSLSKSFFDSDIDTTIFVFNSPGGNGFAVISADARIPQQVLAYSETGNLELDSDNPAFDVFLSYATDYAAECIAKAQEQRDSIEAAIMEKLGIEIDLDTVGTLSKTKHVIQKFLITSMCYTDISVETLAEVKPLITTNWTQHAPYNDSVGGRDKCFGGYLAGCVAVATSQLMVFWRYPKIINGIAIDWDMLSNDDNVGNPIYNQHAAILTSFVGTKINTKYGCDRSSASTSDVLWFLLANGYKVYDGLVSYKYDKVIKCLDEGWPVLMEGKRTKEKKWFYSNYLNGHEWIADGFVHQKVHQRDRLTYAIVEIDDETGRGSCRYEYSGGYQVSESKYLHLNWGWGEASNGYYCQDVFHVKDRYVLRYDGVYVRSSVDDDRNFQYKLKMVDGIHREQRPLTPTF